MKRLLLLLTLIFSQAFISAQTTFTLKQTLLTKMVMMIFYLLHLAMVLSAGLKMMAPVILVHQWL